MRMDRTRWVSSLFVDVGLWAMSSHWECLSHPGATLDLPWPSLTCWPVVLPHSEGGLHSRQALPAHRGRALRDRGGAYGGARRVRGVGDGFMQQGRGRPQDNNLIPTVRNLQPPTNARSTPRTTATRYAPWPLPPRASPRPTGRCSRCSCRPQQHSSQVGPHTFVHGWHCEHLAIFSQTVQGR